MLRISNLTYYDNKEEHGPVIDWGLVFQEYRKLKVPAGLYDPTRTPVDKAHLCDIISIRSRGKTTAWLLIGLIVWQIYGCTTAYIRQIEDMTAPVNSGELLNILITYERGRYIRQITNEEYNSIIIHDRRAYLVLIDDNGQIVKKCEQAWLNLLSIDRSEIYKSSLNLPLCALIMFDEFISRYYANNEFVAFNQLLSTIIRKRRTPIVVMLANNIDVHNQYFREQEISRDVMKMKIGESKIIYSSKGTPVYVEIDKPPKASKHVSIVNRLFFGFSNPKLASITGESENAWEFDIYPHITHEDDEKFIARNLYLDVNDEFLNVEIVAQPTLGLVAFVHPSTRSYRDSIILTTGPITDPRHQFGQGFAPAAVALWMLYKKNKVYFADNETGSMFDQYVNMCKIAKK